MMMWPTLIQIMRRYKQPVWFKGILDPHNVLYSHNVPLVTKVEHIAKSWISKLLATNEFTERCRENYSLRSGFRIIFLTEFSKSTFSAAKSILMFSHKYPLSTSGAISLRPGYLIPVNLIKFVYRSCTRFGQLIYSCPNLSLLKKQPVSLLI